MKITLLILACILVPGQGFATKHVKTIYCQEPDTTKKRGIIIEEAELTKDNGKHQVIFRRVGIGELTDHGDGTGNGEIISGEATVTPNWDYSASSAEWKDAVPFLLPAEVKGTHVVYIQPEHFFLKMVDGFRVRLKVEKNGKTKNYTLNCQEI